MNELVAFALLVGLAWGAVFVLRGSIVVGGLSVLLASCCFGYFFVHFALGPLPMTIDRLLLGLLIAAYVVQRALRRTDPKPMHAADWLTAALVGYLLLNMLSSDWRTVQKGDISPLWRWFGGYFAPLVLYWGAKQAPWTERTSNLVPACLTAFGLYLAVTALCEIAHLWAFVFPSYIADPKVGLHFGRARGPMVHGVSYGHYQGVCLLAAWLTAWRLRGAARAAIVGLLPLFAAGVYFSYTRSVWMGAGLGLCTLFCTTLRGRTRSLVLGGVAAAALIVGATQMEKIVGFQREQSAADTADSANLRVSFAYVSWLMFQDRPLFGFGFGRFPGDKLPYLADRSSELHLEALRPYVHHNSFLSLLVDTGLVGLGLFLAMLAAWIVQAWRTYAASDASDGARRRAILLLGAVGVYAPQLLFHELSYTLVDNALVFFLAGASSAAATARSAVVRPRRAEVVSPRSVDESYAVRSSSVLAPS